MVELSGSDVSTFSTIFQWCLVDGSSPLIRIAWLPLSGFPFSFSSFGLFLGVHILLCSLCLSVGWAHLSDLVGYFVVVTHYITMFFFSLLHFRVEAGVILYHLVYFIKQLH